MFTEKRFDKVLIANRGAIACRVIRTLRRLGIRSVAVYSEADKHSLHVLQADEAICIGAAPAAESYLKQETLLAVARQCGAQAIHPGYGFLSENAAFAEVCAAAGIVFIGPTPQQMRDFGLKHTARALAQQANVPMLPGSGLLSDLEHAVAEAQRVGYPAMLKSTAGGGGIGMQLCRNEAELRDAFYSVERLAKNNFSQGGMFLEKYVERARHIEVQIFGDGRGQVVALGERDCSLQRRNQKVVEETPAPGLSDAVRQQLMDNAVRLSKSVNYQSAGTVEFVYDIASNEFYFLEVNTRLQVEHGVTEQVTGVDLVEWMIRVAEGRSPLADYRHRPQGHSIQVRLYAEDPARNFRPSSGLLTEVRFPECPHPNPPPQAGEGNWGNVDQSARVNSNPPPFTRDDCMDAGGRATHGAVAECRVGTSDTLRVDTWIRTGTEVSAYYDPMLAKLISHASTREQALQALQTALAQTSVYGIETNLDYLRNVLADEVFARGEQYTRYLGSKEFHSATIEVLQPGTQSCIQDYPGRIGYWDIGVPPSGPMDHYAFRLANRLLGNDAQAAALELTVTGPTLKFNVDSMIALTGAAMRAELDGQPMPSWQAVTVKRGSVLKLRGIQGGGQRAYLAVQGGFDVPLYMGSRSTFTLGQFGGHGGRALRVCDVLRIQQHALTQGDCVALPTALIPRYQSHWRIAVMYGPHGAPDFFTQADIETFFATRWQVHYNSSRTGVRLIGPKPQWARRDGGEAGLHPSNIHDNAYAIGAVDFTGDMPVILGPDGPSLGGFVCPVTLVQAELWKMGQLKPGDTIEFYCVSYAQAVRLRREMDAATDDLVVSSTEAASFDESETGSACLACSPDQSPTVCYRQAGDAYLLVEYGEQVLDLELRFRVHALMQYLQAKAVPGVQELTPGIRSLQVHYDSRVISQQQLLTLLQQAEHELPAVDDVEVPSRIVHLPLSWDDPATQLAIDKYMQSVRADAPWCPSNIEFIRRINGLESIEDVYRILFEASYLVMGLGDVYLGAPVATPLDPRHRLVTTKYNPARTWTPENAVGIGGAYLCVYGMEGPGGYQFVGRTVQMWNRYRQTQDFKDGKQWLLRFFDQIRFYPVSATELLQMREDFIEGQFQLRVEATTLRLRDYRQYLQQHRDSIAEFKARQQAAFEAERQRWAASGQLAVESEPSKPVMDDSAIPADCIGIASPVTGSVWQLSATPGTRLVADAELLVVEAMKMEIPICVDENCELVELRCVKGKAVTAGEIVAVVRPQANVS
ncbi:MAG: 5-oxoprolinase/urea amidolyase family protein [Steroidobacteraceae bacterium]